MNLSIIIPTLNAEKEIENCLLSLKPQLSPNDEVIIVDAGSQDKTLQISYDYGCRLFIYPDSTIGAARNLGVEVAKNPIVMQTDSDVIFPSNHIERLKQYFSNQVVAVAGPSQDARGRIMVNLGASVRSEIASFGGPAGEENMAFTREAYYQTGGFEPTNMCEGLKLWAELGGVGLRVFDPSLFVFHSVESWHWTSLPSYLIAGTLLASGAAYEAGVGGAVGSALMGAGAGFGLGQLGVDLGINKDAPPDHFHHLHLGLIILALGITLYGVDENEDLAAGLMGFGSSLAIHDLITDENL